MPVAAIVCLMPMLLNPSKLLGSEDPMANTSDWPGWRGPNSSGATGHCGDELVATGTDARFLWSSEVEIPTGDVVSLIYSSRF